MTHASAHRGILLSGALLGGLTMFVVCMISWMALPWHMQSFRAFKDEALVADVLRHQAPTHGVYALPSMRADGRAGAVTSPKVFAAIYPPGCSESNMPRYLLIELLTCVLGAGLLAQLLLMAGPMSFARRVGFSALTGALVALASYAPDWNWWRFPLDFILPGVFDSVIATALGGLVIAWIIGRAERSAAA